MGLVSGSLLSLVNGVSLQPPWMRLPSQGTAQENAMSSLIEGVWRRPPTEHIARISATSLGAAHIHSINRDSDQRYQVIVTDGDLRVFDLEGNEKTVAFPSGKAYLAALAPKTAFSCTTLADYTFVTNREKTVDEENAGNTVTNEAYFYVKQAFYNCSYGAYINGALVATVTTAATGNQPQTDAIAGSLSSSLASALGGTWTVTASGSVIRVKKNDNTTFTVSSYDSQGGVALIAFGRSIQNFVDLPPVMPFDGTIEVTGSSTNGFDSYWVTFDGTKQSWVEVVKPEDEARPDPETMPWKLVEEIDGTFTFDKNDWGWRACGDANSAPTPSLVGRQVNDVLVHRNRLFFLADQNILSSRPGGPQFFELFPATVTTALNSDPIDVGLSNNNNTVPIARFALAFDQDLLIFTDPAQFRLNASDQVMTSATVKATQAAGYDSDLLAKPVSNGKLVHFAIRKGSDSGVREGFIDSQALVFDASDITIHVPNYIEGRITKFVSATNLDTLFVLATGAPNKVWVYKWFIENNEKMQSSWSQWVFPEGDTILSISFMDSDLYMLVERSTGVYLERIRLDEAYQDDGLEFAVRLDRKCYVTGTYDAGTDRTSWTLPYDLTGLDPVAIYGAAFETRPGFATPALTVDDAAAGEVSLKGDRTEGACIFGVRYLNRYRLSTIYLTGNGADGKGRSAITDGRLQLRNIFVNYKSSAYFQVEVSAPGRPVYTYTYATKTLGQNLTVGRIALDTGRFRVPVYGRNTDVTIDIVSDSHLPCSILSIDWEGEFNLRSRRV